MEMDLVKIIKEYYEKRGLKWPNFDNAMKFAATEIGEAYEVDLARYEGWVRNNPDGKPAYFDKQKLGDELGDIIMMVMVAGIVEGLDPLAHLIRKINRKLTELNNQMQFPKDERGIEYFDPAGGWVEHEPDYSEGDWK